MAYLKPVTKPALAHHGRGGHAPGPPWHNPGPSKVIPETMQIGITMDKFVHHFIEHAGDEE